MDRRPNLLPGALVRADRLNPMTRDLQRLERHHQLVVLDEIPHQHENLGHSITPFQTSVSNKDHAQDIRRAQYIMGRIANRSSGLLSVKVAI